MSKNVVADFAAFLSVAVDGEQTFEEPEGRVEMTRRKITLGDGEETKQLPVESVAAFDFRTVPTEWEQFFDDLVGLRFVQDGEEVTATIGADTAVADRFVTVLLKLLLDDSETRVRQKTYPLESDDSTPAQANTTLTLLPTSERLQFGDETVKGIDIATVTGISRREEGRVMVHHLCEAGRVTTELTPERSRGAQFLQTYLDFRSEISESGGPVKLLFVGEDRDALVLVAKLLKHRKLSFEATHVRSGDRAIEVVEDDETPVECVLAEYDLAETTAADLRGDLDDVAPALPFVCFTRERGNGQEADFDVIELGERTAHYEDVVDAIERAVITARL